MISKGLTGASLAKEIDEKEKPLRLRGYHVTRIIKRNASSLNKTIAL